MKLNARVGVEGQNLLLLFTCGKKEERERDGEVWLGRREKGSGGGGGKKRSGMIRMDGEDGGREGGEWIGSVEWERDIIVIWEMWKVVYLKLLMIMLSCFCVTVTTPRVPFYSSFSVPNHFFLFSFFFIFFSLLAPPSPAFPISIIVIMPFFFHISHFIFKCT